MKNSGNLAKHTGQRTPSAKFRPKKEKKTSAKSEDPDDSDEKMSLADIDSAKPSTSAASGKRLLPDDDGLQDPETEDANEPKSLRKSERKRKPLQRHPKINKNNVRIYKITDELGLLSRVDGQTKRCNEE